MNYSQKDGIVTITMDDGKANAVGHTYLDRLNEALDRAEQVAAGAIILRGRAGIFSAGFDLKEFQSSKDGGLSMVSKGIELLIRLYSFPLPLVAACTGHGIAMGAFLLLACDYRVGTRGDFRITLPETALSMTIPGTMLALTQARLATPYLTRALVQAEVFAPELAVQAGFLDEVVDPDDLQARTERIAGRLAELPAREYALNKLATHASCLGTMRTEYQQLVKQTQT